MSIVKLEDLASEIREKKARAKWIRAKYVSQRAFLRRWVPGIAPRLEACGTQYRVMESTVKRGRYIAVPQRCDELPWSRDPTRHPGPRRGVGLEPQHDVVPGVLRRQRGRACGRRHGR